MKASIIRTSTPSSYSAKRGADQYLEAFDDSMNGPEHRFLKLEEFAKDRGWSDGWTAMVREYLEKRGVL